MNAKGFTLAELLISMAVGAILLSVGVPSYTSFVQNSRQVTAANELLASMHLARDLAITRNVRVTLCPSSNGLACEAAGWDAGWIVFPDPDDSRTVGADETIERAVIGVPAPSLTSGEFADFVVYRPNGRAMADTVADNSGEFTICDRRGAAHARVVAIDFSGRPQVSRHLLDGSVPVCPDPS